MSDVAKRAEAPERTSTALLPAIRSFALVTLASFCALVGLRAVGYEGYATGAVAVVLYLAAQRGIERMPGGHEAAGARLGGLLDGEGADEGPLGLIGLAKLVVRGIPSALREFAFALAVMAAVLVPFSIGYVVWFGLRGEVTPTAPEAFLGLALTQLVLVAVPEEAYFRGYLLTKFASVFPNEPGILGGRFPVRALVLQAALFALLHFVTEPNPARLAVFFPALLFGWAKLHRGGLGAPVYLHALANLLSEWLALSVR